MARGADAAGLLVERRPVRAPQRDGVEVLELLARGAETLARREAEARLEGRERNVVRAAGPRRVDDADGVRHVNAAHAPAVARAPAAEAAYARVAQFAFGGADGRVAVVVHLEHLAIGQDAGVDPADLVHVAELRVVLDDHAAEVDAPEVQERQLGGVCVRDLHCVRHIDRSAYAHARARCTADRANDHQFIDHWPSTTDR